MNKLRLFLLLSFVLLLTGCSEENKAWEPYSPLNTSSLMKQYASEDNYEQFKHLLQEGHDEESIKRIYETVRQATSDSAEINTFTLVTFDNGKTLLVHLTPQTSKDGKVLIQDVIEIPTETATYIEKELNKKYEK
ncbi:hypothetical protein ACLM5H_23260 [Fredinandcohnia humi]